MDIFISWHGDVSRKVAEALRDWLPCVIQEAKPFLSSEDIHKGAVWFGEVSDRLDKSTIGILCLTPDNLEAPWIHFEAGAVSKQVGPKCVIPLLIGLKATDLKPPLSYFQAALPNKADVLRLVQTMNATLGEKKLAEETLRKIFDKWWPELEEKLTQAKDALARGEPKAPARAQEDILREILELVRGLAQGTMGSRFQGKAKADLFPHLGLFGSGASQEGIIKLLMDEHMRAADMDRGKGPTGPTAPTATERLDYPPAAAKDV